MCSLIRTTFAQCLDKFVTKEELWAPRTHPPEFCKTQVWNKGGAEPSGVEAMTRAALLLMCPFRCDG